MNEQLKMVRDFHDAFDYEQMEHGNEGIPVIAEKVVYARMSFITEELAEILLSLASGDKEKQLDGAVDLSYFTLGTLAIIGKDVYEAKDDFTYVDDGLTADKKIHERSLVEAACKVICHMTFRDTSVAIDGLVGVLSHLHHCCVNFAEKGIKADFFGAFEEVQRSNMSKLGADGKPIYNDAGKILKGPDFSEPVLAPFLYASA